VENPINTFVYALYSSNIIPNKSCFSFVRFFAVIYYGYFIKELVKSNLAIAGVVLSPSLPINPGIVKVRTKLKTRMGRLMLANSITLTPGTVTVDLQGDELLVHALTRSSGKAVEDGQLDRRVPLDCEGRG
jgi:multisubunit Na+/H+ antiporter MnhE subunit